MKTENVIGTPVALERVGTFSVVRTLDLDKLAAEAEDGRVSVEKLTGGGEWGVKLQPSARGSEATTYPAADQASAEAFIAGAGAVVAMRKKGPRGAVDESFDPASIKRGTDLMALGRTQLRLLNGHYGIEFKQNDNKGTLAANLKGKLPK